MIPRLHVVTDDEVLAGAGFIGIAAALAERLGDELALHLRGHRTPARRLHALALEAEAALAGTGARLLIADRIDVALATERAGVRLSGMSLPVTEARRLMGDRLIACSVHAVEEGVAASREGADCLVLGTIWATPSHPGRGGAGPVLIRAMAGRVDVPIVAIGGVTPERTAEALAAGAHGVAVLRGVWAGADPVSAAERFRAALTAATAGAAS